MKQEDKELLLDVLPKYMNSGLKLQLVSKNSFRNGEDVINIVKMNCVEMQGCFKKRYGVRSCKPILYPLTKEVIEEILRVKCNYDMAENGLVWYSLKLNHYIFDINVKDTFPKFLCEALYKKHVDLDGLLEKGLAVNGNEIEKL